MSARRTFRFGLQAKVLVAVVGFLVLLPAVTLWIVNRHITRQMEDEALQTLIAAESVFVKSLENRSRGIVSRYTSIVAEARFKVTAEIGDPRTLEGLLTNLLQDSPEEHEAMVFVNADARMIAGRRRASSIDLTHFSAAAAPLSLLALGGEPSSGSVAFDGRMYSVIVVPVSAPTGVLVGALAVGVRITEATITELRLPRTEILLASGDDVLVATVTGRALPQSLLALRTAEHGTAQPVSNRRERAEHVTIGGEHFMARSGRIDGTEIGAQAIEYVILSSYEQRLVALKETRRTLAELSLAGVVVSALVVSWFVRRATRPLRQLSETAEAVGRGDFSRRVERFSNDECGELADAFNRMTTSLQSSRAELERALQQVRTTQEQLIQSEKLSAVGQFVAGVAHELNNPLTAVVGYSELLQSMSSDEKMRENLDRISRSALRCHKIVHSLLSFARQHAPERKLVQLHAVVDEVLEIMAYDLRTSNVRIVREFASTLPPIMADGHQLQQVFVNILGNARQAIQPVQREGRIVIRTRQAGDKVLIEFQDNGPGIKTEHLARIFDPFFTTKPVGKGTGLGLSLCYGLIREHGGDISARSEPGEGATFAIELPVAVNSAVPTVFRSDRSLAPFPAVQPAASGKCVLVVDDEPWILDLASELARAEGHAVDTASGGEQALQKIARCRFDVIISDWKMPGLNGIGLYEHLRAIDPPAAGRVVFMTGDVVSDTFQDFLREHELKCLSKPFARREFQAAMRGVVPTC
jgi:two-component system, NtrC family, sensor kinase